MCNLDSFTPPSMHPTAHVEIPCHRRGCTHINTYVGPNPVDGIASQQNAHAVECIGVPCETKGQTASTLQTLRKARGLQSPFATGRRGPATSQGQPTGEWQPAFNRRARLPGTGPGELNMKSHMHMRSRVRKAAKQARADSKVALSESGATIERNPKVATKPQSVSRVLNRGGHRKRLDVHRESKKVRRVGRAQVKEWTLDPAPVPVYEPTTFWAKYCPSEEYNAWLNV
ncbi:hypothetical protein FB45DRAFT_876499 [Roridomyces roridus]|uniref:Uncharacterized protein n=1 Tax=Roridomyces roridus TaxID=1738132 RepID=A0AAD7B4A0_9AGAR|nr:hypothetical protein FB45DRAFT_876499 [Roridomyces roridus]